jgi:two-component system NtrC family sensor kinase
MILVVIVVSFLPMVLSVAIGLHQFRKSYGEKVNAHLMTLVKKHKMNIDGFLREKLGNILFLGKTFSYEELSNESFLQDRLAALQEAHGPVFVDLSVIRENGLQVAYAGPFKLGKALYSTAEWFQKAMKSEYYISDVFLGLRGLPHFIVAVRENWKGESFILRATIDFVEFNNLVEKIRIGETGFAFILNQMGEFQTRPYADILENKKPYMDLLRNGRIMGDEIIVDRMKAASGKRYIYVAASLKGGDWVLVYQQDVSDAFKDLDRTVDVSLVILLVGGMAIVATAFLVSRRMVARIARADQEKQMMNEQIVETGKLASVGELAAGIAHEINNPVAIMVEEAGWMEDLLSEEELKESKNIDEFKRALRQINTQGKRCKEITHKLLSFARKTEATIQDVQINEVIEEVVSLSSQRAKYANVTIATHLEPAVPKLRVSRTELQQVFLNLINNALDAMEKGGGTLKLNTGIEEGRVVVEVGDTGSGIPAANLSRIFDPFFTTKPVGKGTGLGLSICYGIVKKMGGDIEVRSTVDVGTTFRVFFPISKEA